MKIISSKEKFTLIWSKKPRIKKSCGKLAGLCIHLREI